MEVEWAAENSPEDFWRWGAMALLERMGHRDKDEIEWALEEFMTGGDYTTKRRMKETQRLAREAMNKATGKNMVFEPLTRLPGSGMKVGG